MKISKSSSKTLVKWFVLLATLIQPGCQESQTAQIQEDNSSLFIVDAEPTTTLHVEPKNTPELAQTDEPMLGSAFFLGIPPPRSGHAMVYDPQRQRIVLLGGRQTVSQEDRLFNHLTDTWEYDGTIWTRIETIKSPEPRSTFAMIYHEVEEKIIAFGGYNDYPEPWQYDGQDWQRIDASHSLLPPSAVYFPKTDDVITPYECWQKCDTSFYMTWHFDGQTWFEGDEIFPYGEAGQDPFLVPQIVYDSHREVVVFQIQWPWTFEFDGQTWKLVYGKDDVEGNLPPLDGAFNMVYDSHRKVVVLYGLARGDSVCRTWEYDGERWEEVELEMNPPPRAWSAMAFDEARGVTVLFGGEWDGQDLNDLWEYDGQEWVRRDFSLRSD